MEEALPIALGTLVVLAVRPLRRRVVPVVRSTVAATVGVGAAAVAGVGAIASAAAHGDPPPRERRGER